MTPNPGDSHRPNVPPGLVLLAGVLSISTGAIFARLAEAPALVIAAWRVGLATLILLPFAWFSARDDLRRLTIPDIRLAALSGLFLALHFATWISSLDYTSVANSVVIVNTNPLWVALFAPFLTGDRISRGAAVGIGVSVIGGVIIGAGDVALGGRALLGDGLALLGSLCAAAYLLLGRRIRAKLSLLAYVVVCYGSAAVFLWATVLALRLPIVGFSAGTFGAFAGMAIISQCIGHTSYNWALRYFSASLVAISLLGEPIGSTILAWFLFGEQLTLLKAAGGALILAGIVCAALGETRQGVQPADLAPPG